MKAQRSVGLNLSWTRVTLVFLIVVGLLVIGSHWPGSAQTALYAWWTSVGIAALVAIIALVTLRRVPLSTVLAAWVSDQFADPKTLLAEGRTRATDHQRRYGRGVVGMREYRGHLVTVIAVGGRSVVPAGRHHRGDSAAVPLPVDLVADGLRQFDVRLESIDIVSAGAHDGDPDGIRETWVVLRMDPQSNVYAVAARDSLAATLAAATERLAHELDGRTITARVLSAEEITAVDTAVLAGLEPAQIRGRLSKKQGDGYVTNFWVSPRDITSEHLDELWETETTATVVTVRLVPGHGRTTDISALVRYHSSEKLPKTVRSALNRLIGRRQLAAIGASLPVPGRHQVLMVPTRQLHDQEELTISLDPATELPVVRVGATQ